MEERKWQQLYIYGKDYETYLRNFIDEKRKSGQVLTVSDFSSIDIIRPSKNEIVGEFIEKHQLGNRLDCLDVGSGIGGMCRYLANLGHNATGYDILPHYVEIGSEINSLVGLSDKVRLIHGNIAEADIPENSFDLITCLGVLLCVPGAGIIEKLSKLLRPGGALFIEDYILLKEFPDLIEAQNLNRYHCIPIRTKKEYEIQMTSAGLEIFEFVDKSRETSEFAWKRAENMLIRFNNGECKADEIEIYADLCPRILNSVDHLGKDEILIRFPNVSQRLGIENVLNADKLLTWMSLAARKNSN
jgi:2-polyprenyl-3-methyl-5-hydroxy-6-metoxy-1,4-benzoquinol methylase